MSRGGAWSALVLSVGLSGCVYYNAMWSAERHAKDARAFEQRGQLLDARSAWAQAAEKAGNVALRHPRSHWADDALALEAEGRSEEHTSELQSHSFISYAVFCLK